MFNLYFHLHFSQFVPKTKLAVLTLACAFQVPKHICCATVSDKHNDEPRIRLRPCEAILRVVVPESICKCLPPKHNLLYFIYLFNQSIMKYLQKHWHDPQHFILETQLRLELQFILIKLLFSRLGQRFPLPNLHANDIFKRLKKKLS